MLKRKDFETPREPTVDIEELKRLSRGPVEAEAREFCISLGLETPQQMRDWCIQKCKGSKILKRVRFA